MRPIHSFAAFSTHDDGVMTPRRPSVLVVDDVALVRLLVGDYLRDAGFEAIEAASADDAMRMLDGGLEVDVLFTDLVMPGKADGVALALWVREHYPDIKVVLGSGVAAATERAMALGFGEPLVKPYRQSALQRRLRDVLGHNTH